MMFTDTKRKTIYIDYSVRAEDLVVALMKAGGIDWKDWKIDYVENVIYLDGNYDIAPDAMINQLDLFSKLTRNN